jgi:hypothetical protein
MRASSPRCTSAPARACCADSRARSVSASVASGLRIEQLQLGERASSAASSSFHPAISRRRA